MGCKESCAALLLGLALAPPASACEPAMNGEGVRRISGKDYVLAWRPEPAPLRVSEFFALEVAVCSNAANAAAPAELRVDAVMPEHKHGMNYRPTVAASGAGRFRAEGLLLHMPGIWEFSFDVRGSAGNEVVRERVSLR
jgi:hypothetical protein